MYLSSYPSIHPSYAYVSIYEYIYIYMYIQIRKLMPLNKWMNESRNRFMMFTLGQRWKISSHHLASVRALEQGVARGLRDLHLLAIFGGFSQGKDVDFTMKNRTGCWFGPFWTIWKSIGITIPNIWEKKKCSFLFFFLAPDAMWPLWGRRDGCPQQPS